VEDAGNPKGGVMNADDRLCLREGVSVRSEKVDCAERYVLDDGVQGFRLIVNRGVFLVAGLLDGTKNGDEVFKALAERGHRVDPGVLEDFLNYMRKYYLLDEERARRRVAHVTGFRPAAEAGGAASAGVPVPVERAASAGRPAPSEEVPILFPANARFSCLACGACCKGLFINVTADERERLTGFAAHMGLAKPGEAPALFAEFIDPTRPSTTVHYMKKVRGGCPFFDGRSRCRIHELYGYEAKPFSCRMFPYQVVQTPVGFAVSIGFLCTKMFEAVTGGESLVDQRDALRRLAYESNTPFKLIPLVSFTDKACIPFELYDLLEKRCLEALEGASPTVSALVRLRNIVTAVSDQILSFPLEEDFQRARDFLEGKDFLEKAAERFAGADPGRFFESLALILHLLGAVCIQYLVAQKDRSQKKGREGAQIEGEGAQIEGEGAQIEGEGAQIEGERQAGIALHSFRRQSMERFVLVVVSLLARLHPERACSLPVGLGFDPGMLDAVAFPEEGEVDGLMKAWLSHELFGKRHVVAFGVTAGYGVLILKHILVRWAARLEATRRDETAVRIDDCTEALRLVNYSIPGQLTAQALQQGKAHLPFLLRDFCPETGFPF
jgi:Fe-S-cluster containining protein